MDNITHSLVGAALSEVALHPRATMAQRRLYLAVGVVASNLPDLDLVYVGITPPPLGYLLHHRGHTHTILGLLPQGLVIALVCRLLPAAWKAVAGARARLWALVAVSLFVHLLMDASNSYGVHPLHPFDSRWYYGDAVFILEPWLWLLPGIAVAGNARTRPARIAIAGLLVVLPLGLARLGIVGGGALVALAVAATGLGWGARRLSPRARAAAALGASAVFIALLFGLSRRARAETTALLGPEVRGEIVDVVLNPNPASPLCWALIGIEKDEPAGEFALHRGTLSLLHAWQPPADCASHRLAAVSEARTSGGGRLAWSARIRQPLAPLRDRARRDCWVRAWLQFGRAPYFRDGEIADARFDDGRGDNFTAMELRPEGKAARCPPHVTSWGMPRADLLGGPHRSGGLVAGPHR